MCSAQRIINLEYLNSVSWRKCEAKCGENHPKWVWIAGINQQREVSTNKLLRHIYALDQEGFLKIKDIEETDNGTLYRCTVQYYNEPTMASLNQVSDHIYLQFKQEEGNIYTSTNIIEKNNKIYYMEESVLLGTKPLVDSIRHFIRHPSGVFSVCHLFECRIVQWRHDSRLLLLLNWFLTSRSFSLHIIKRTLHGGSKIWILCSHGKSKISLVRCAHSWDIVLASRT